MGHTPSYAISSESDQPGSNEAFVRTLTGLVQLTLRQSDIRTDQDDYYQAEAWVSAIGFDVQTALDRYNAPGFYTAVERQKQAELLMIRVVQLVSAWHSLNRTGVGGGVVVLQQGREETPDERFDY